MNRRRLLQAMAAVFATLGLRPASSRTRPPYLILRSGHYDHVEITDEQIEQMAVNWMGGPPVFVTLTKAYGQEAIGVVTVLAALWDEDGRRSLYADVDWLREGNATQSVYLSCDLYIGWTARLLELPAVLSIQQPRRRAQIPLHAIPVLV